MSSIVVIWTPVQCCNTNSTIVMTCQNTSFLIYQHSEQHTLRFHHGVLRVNFGDYRLAIPSVVASSIYIVCGSDGCYWEYDSIESEDFVDDFAENEGFVAVKVLLKIKVLPRVTVLPTALNWYRFVDALNDFVTSMRGRYVFRRLDAVGTTLFMKR